MDITVIMKLLTGVSLFLFGMTLMSEGLKKVAGNQMETVLGKLTGSPCKGILFGTAVTTVIQSSSATTVMVVSFVNSGILRVRQAIPVILGAILGTSITGWVICLSELEGVGGVASIFSTSTLICVTAVLGIVLKMFSKKVMHNRIGEVLLGFAVLMHGMSTMSGAVGFLKDSEAFAGMLVKFSNPLLGIFVGIIFTCVLQSASAAVGILQVLTVTGGITFEVVLPLIIGISIGAAVPVLLSAIGAIAEGKQTALAYLTSNVMGALFVGVLFYGIAMFVEIPFMSSTLTMVTVALVNTIYRLIVILVLSPFCNLIAGLSERVFKVEAEEIDDDGLMPLDDRFVSQPSMAVEQCRKAIFDMAERACDGLQSAIKLRHEYSEETYNNVVLQENVVDVYEDKIGTYLMKVSTWELDEIQVGMVSKFLHTLSDFERISDLARNLAESTNEIRERNIELTDEIIHELDVMEAAVSEIVESTITAFESNDLVFASKIEPLEDVIDNLCSDIKANHMNRINSGLCTYELSFVFSDMLTNYERIADHCSNIAIAMISINSNRYDTHEYLHNIKKKDELFEVHSEEYMKKYFL